MKQFNDPNPKNGWGDDLYPKPMPANYYRGLQYVVLAAATLWGIATYNFGKSPVNLSIYTRTPELYACATFSPPSDLGLAQANALAGGQNQVRWSQDDSTWVKRTPGFQLGKYKYQPSRFDAPLLDILIVQDTSNRNSFNGHVKQFRHKLQATFAEQIKFHRLNTQFNKQNWGEPKRASIMQPETMNVPVSETSAKAWRKAIKDSRIACGFGETSFYNAGTVLVKTHDNHWYAFHTPSYKTMTLYDDDQFNKLPSLTHAPSAYKQPPASEMAIHRKRTVNIASVTSDDIVQIAMKHGGLLKNMYATRSSDTMITPFETDPLFKYSGEAAREFMRSLSTDLLKAVNEGALLGPLPIIQKWTSQQEAHRAHSNIEELMKKEELE